MSWRGVNTGGVPVLRDRRSDRRQHKRSAFRHGHRAIALERIRQRRAWIGPARLFHLIPTAPEEWHRRNRTFGLGPVAQAGSLRATTSVTSPRSSAARPSGLTAYLITEPPEP